MSTNYKKFGFTDITSLKASELYLQNYNIYICYYYRSLATGLLEESEMILLSKEFIKQNLNNDKTKFLKSLELAYTLNMLGCSVLDFFYYTDNRKVIPNKYLEFLPLESANINQGVFDF